MTAIIRPITTHPGAFRFQSLASWTRQEVAVWNWCRRFVRGTPQWKSWIQDGWGDLLNVPAGVEVSLLQKHAVDPQEQARKHSFQQHEIFIGRQTENDITLPTQSAGKRHARIFVENGRCFVEDLGTSLGTYVNNRKLATKRPEPLSTGDQVAIFPYVFAITVRQLWARQTDIGVYSGSAEPMTWQTFLNTSTSGRTSFSIEVHPGGRSAMCLEVGRAFLVEFTDRLLRPLELESPLSVLSGADSALLEFMIVSLLERVNRDLELPYQFQTRPCGSKPKLAPETRGIAIACSLNLLAITGVLRVFVPCSLLDGMSRTRRAPPSETAGVRWSFPVSVGHAQFPLRDISGLETNDVVLFKPGLTLQFPGSGERGWTLSTDEEPVTVAAWGESGNFRRLKIDKYFERQPLNGEALDENEDRGPTPDVSELPVRVDVIVAQKELTLSEANYLVSGTILELDRENSGRVSLAINGKIVGDGELVDVEGRLGVKVLGWKQT